MSKFRIVGWTRSRQTVVVDVSGERNEMVTAAFVKKSNVT